jgi:hypothetical protein
VERRIVIVRAILALAVIAVLVPHEPDLGLGKPDAVPVGSAAAAEACHTLGGSDAACAALAVDAAPGARFSGLQAMVFARLRAARADIENSREANRLVGDERGRAADAASPRSFSDN